MNDISGLLNSWTQFKDHCQYQYDLMIGSCYMTFTWASFLSGFKSKYSLFFRWYNITSKYSSFVLWAEMELELWANCAKIKKCNQEKKIGNLLNFTSMQWFTTTIPFVILLYRTGLIIKVKVVPFNTAAILSFLSVCSHWFAQTTFFCSRQKIVSCYFVTV